MSSITEGRSDAAEKAAETNRRRKHFKIAFNAYRTLPHMQRVFLPGLHEHRDNMADTVMDYLSIMAERNLHLTEFTHQAFLGGHKQNNFQYMTFSMDAPAAAASSLLLNTDALTWDDYRILSEWTEVLMPRNISSSSGSNDKQEDFYVDRSALAVSLFIASLSCLKNMDSHHPALAKFFHSSHPKLVYQYDDRDTPISKGTAHNLLNASELTIFTTVVVDGVMVQDYDSSVVHPILQARKNKTQKKSLLDSPTNAPPLDNTFVPNLVPCKFSLWTFKSRSRQAGIASLLRDMEQYGTRDIMAKMLMFVVVFHKFVDEDILRLIRDEVVMAEVDGLKRLLADDDEYYTW